MFLGVDVGGTHTDAVLTDGQKTLAAAKAPTQARVISSLNAVLSELLNGADPKGIKRLTVSTTLGLNSVLTGTAPPVGIMVTGGPGLDLNPKDWGPLFRELPASQDHRGQVIKPLEYLTALSSARELAQKAETIVVASKFGPKNQTLEETMFKAALAAAPGPVMAASSLFGRLNFARRLGGTVLNGAVKKLYDLFLQDLEQSVRERGLTCPVWILKADGGVMDITQAKEKPVLALAAGPAASLLGLWALVSQNSRQSGRDETEDILMIDMGGTSTDLAVFSQGPLLTPEGLTLAGRPTLVRGLLTHSLALGGDTDLEPRGEEIVPVPQRRGPALALAEGGDPERPPTLTDALNVLGLADLGNKAVSEKAFEKIAPGRAQAKASQAVEAVLARLKEAKEEFIRALNRQPAYTISEFLVDRQLKPTKAVILGGPARTMAPLVSQALGLPTEAPPEAATANALGAALARPTREAELYADTAAGTMSIPTLNVSREIPARYTLDEAKNDLLAAMGDEAVQITQAEIFNQVSDYGASGRVIKVRAQSRPGLI
ncbi:MAG: hypothetical protein LBP22_16170 [Deltaproteobacteria bacterium]|jgi:N-methylhydantoinase A/oxoprolinase/acetone carboxylase beta subunit|nr:hypothetical protein [Deltaproteobacteria bacterium]